MVAFGKKPDPPPLMMGGDIGGPAEPLSSEEEQLIAWKDQMALALVQGSTGETASSIQVASGYPSSYITDARSRQQNEYWWCGAASAQVIINRTRGYFVSGADPESTSSNYKKQSTIAAYIGITNSGSTYRTELRDVLNAYADLSATGTQIPFSVINTSTGALFHSRVKISSWSWNRGMGVPIKLTSSQRLASWNSNSWWTSYEATWGPGTAVYHWIVTIGYAGSSYDGTYGPKVYYDDSAAGWGGGTGRYSESSRRVYERNLYAGQLVY